MYNLLNILKIKLPVKSNKVENDKISKFNNIAC